VPRTETHTVEACESRHSVHCADGYPLTLEQTAPVSGWNGGVIIIVGALAVPTDPTLLLQQ